METLSSCLAISAKLKLKKGMELKVISDGEDGILVLKVIESKRKDFLGKRGIGKEILERSRRSRIC